MLGVLTRWMPALFAISVVVMTLHLLLRIWPSASTLGGWQATAARTLHEGGWYFLSAALVLGGIAVASWLHWHARGPRWLYRILPMDILDRLTNKQAVETAATELEQACLVIDADSLTAALKAKVVGQAHVCDDLAQQIRRRLALTQRERPVGVFLFAGPPGTGKTYLAKVLASELQRKLLHFDMAQLAAGPHAATQLFGMTKGYVGSDSYGKLTGGLRDHPQAVVLLDEIEKAHPEVLKAFLTAWNDGFVTEASDGKQIATAQAIFVLTSNAATDALARLQTDLGHDADALRQASVNTLRESGFAPEVLNRIDRVFVFARLGGLDVARVCALETEAMINGYGMRVVDGGVDPQIIIALMQRYRRLGTAASSRDLVRALEESIADSLIRARQQGHQAIELRLVDGHVTARAVGADAPVAKPGAAA